MKGKLKDEGPGVKGVKQEDKLTNDAPPVKEQQEQEVIKDDDHEETHAVSGDQGKEPEVVPDGKQTQEGTTAGGENRNDVIPPQASSGAENDTDKPLGPDWVKMDLPPEGLVMTGDSTSVERITKLYVKMEEDDLGPLAFKNWMERATSSDVNVDHEITEGIDLVQQIAADYDEYYNVSNTMLAGKYILLGKALLLLKQLARKANQMWTGWANINLPFLNSRKRERCMMLAARPDCYRYIALGVERLEALTAATKGLKGKDPIGKLLGQYHILYSQDSETSPTEFKALVDAALNNEKLLEHKINVGFDLVKDLSPKVKFDQTLLRRLHETKASGGTEQGYLEMLSRGGGKAVEVPETDKKLEDFNALSARLIEASDYIVQDQNQERLKKIDIDVFLELVEKLETLKGLLVSSEESKAA